MRGIPTKIQDNAGAIHRHRTESPGKVAKTLISNLKHGKLKRAIFMLLCSIANMRNAGAGRTKEARYLCSCCAAESWSFIHRSNEHSISWNSACPQCGSRSRHRGLTLYLPKLIAHNPQIRRILHVAPEPLLMKAINAGDHLDYKTTDYYAQDVDFPGENLEALSFADASFDMVICNHVLEHVEHDAVAISEISRVLSPDGLAVITIPGDWQREQTQVYAEIDSNGHHRLYGRAVCDIFGRHFQKVDMQDLHDLNKAPGGLSYGIRKNDFAFICKKSQAA